MMRNQHAVLLSLGFLLVSVAHVPADDTEDLLLAFDKSLTKKEQYTTVDFRVVNQVEAEFLRALDEKLEINWVDAPLQDVVDYLAHQHNITILLDEAGLVEEAIAADEPINLKIKALSLRAALRVTLQPLGLAYIIEDNVLKITTQVKVQHRMVRYTYDVRELEQAGYDSNKLAETIRATVTPANWVPESRTTFSPDGKTILRQAKDGTMLEIRDAATGKEVWKAQQEFLGHLQALPGCLVIRARQDVHNEIVELLRQLQHVTKSKPQD